MNKIKGIRWWMIALVTAGLIVNYLARNSLAAAAPTLKQELHISTEQYSWIVASFQAAYMIAQPIAGYVLDILGTKIGFAIFALLWSAVCMAHGAANGWVSLALFRGLLGISEAAGIPSGLKASSEWFPAKERSIATGWFNIGSSIGALIAPPLVIWCIMQGNWRWAFVIIGALGFVWLALWMLFYKHPKDQTRLSDEERDYILSGQEASYKDVQPGQKPSWGKILSSKAFWSIAIPRFLAEPAWQTFNFWIPLYMAEVRHMDLKHIAMFAWLPFLAADLGCVVGGYLAPFFQKHFNVSLITSRKLVVVTGAVCMIGPGCIGLVADPYVAIALFCVGGFAHQTLSGALYTLASDSFGKADVATATGLTGMAGYMGGTIFSLIVGAVAGTIGYNPLFVALAAFDLLGAFVVWNMLKAKAA